VTDNNLSAVKTKYSNDPFEGSDDSELDYLTAD